MEGRKGTIVHSRLFVFLPSEFPFRLKFNTVAHFASINSSRLFLESLKCTRSHLQHCTPPSQSTTPTSHSKPASFVYPSSPQQLGGLF